MGTVIEVATSSGWCIFVGGGAVKRLRRTGAAVKAVPYQNGARKRMGRKVNSKPVPQTLTPQPLHSL